MPVRSIRLLTPAAMTMFCVLPGSDGTVFCAAANLALPPSAGDDRRAGAGDDDLLIAPVPATIESLAPPQIDALPVPPITVSIADQRAQDLGAGAADQRVEPGADHRLVAAAERDLRRTLVRQRRSPSRRPGNRRCRAASRCRSESRCRACRLDRRCWPGIRSPGFGTPLTVAFVKTSILNAPGCAPGKTGATPLLMPRTIGVPAIENSQRPPFAMDVAPSISKISLARIIHEGPAVVV